MEVWKTREAENGIVLLCWGSSQISQTVSTDWRTCVAPVFSVEERHVVLPASSCHFSVTPGKRQASNVAPVPRRSLHRPAESHAGLDPPPRQLLFPARPASPALLAFGAYLPRSELLGLFALEYVPRCNLEPGVLRDRSSTAFLM